MRPRDTAQSAPSGEQADAIAVAAQNLNSFRETWLYPPSWVNRVSDVVAEYPERITVKPGHEKGLNQRTLTKLYNERPTWIDNPHKALGSAGAAAYGWTDYTPAMPDGEILRPFVGT